MTPPETPVDALARALNRQRGEFLAQPESFDSTEAVAAAIFAALTELGWSVERTDTARIKWWVLADIAHKRNESIADVGGHCNHDESPPECMREGQSTAEAYNAALRGGPDATD